MARAIGEARVTLVVSCLLCKGMSRSALSSTRENLTAAVFSNGLQRFALHVQEHRPNLAEVLLDWPDKGKAVPFDDEYRAAFLSGRSVFGISYTAGPLSGHRFADAVHYANMRSCGLLQFADLTVGASRELVDIVEGRKEPGIGVQVLRAIRHNFRGYPDHVLGRGFVISPSDGQISLRIAEGIARYLAA